ncbi:hypothetical protein CRU98_05490 [Arcobacter sp. CECT 8986]|uniref:hypothetical protein n=1 Tax=Arcobacter sp. CECT 8986 TaxID=2044507 RepID=UPI001009E198|nr:hypothetical protein [Arcobacter sp. CECT 8986]RXJ99480.1 hypothetical protein CRU98_05490 [Arcobacter sp. CECT 8986]
MSLYALLIKYEKRIENLTKLEKIKLFLLPILLVLFIYILFFSTQNSLKNIKDKIIYKSLDYDSLNTLKDFSKYCEDNHILVKNLLKESEEITLQVVSTQEKLLKLLYHIESYDSFINIEELNIVNDDNLTLYLTISTNQEYKKSNIKNFNSKLAFLSKKKDIEINKTNAIVFNHFFAQKTWDK